MLLPDYLRPGLRAVIVGVAPTGQWGSPRQRGPSRRGRDGQRRYYAGRGNAFWFLLHAAGLVGEPLGPADDERLPEYGIGLTDVVKTLAPEPDGGVRVDYDSAGLAVKISRFAPDAVAFVSKTAAHCYARGAGLARPTRYGETPWPVGDRPGFVLPGPSGANNGMPLPLRIALWRDLADFLDTLQPAHR